MPPQTRPTSQRWPSCSRKASRAPPPMTGTSHKFAFFLLLSLLWIAPAWAQHKEQHRGPADLKEYIEILERPERDKEQKPDEVIKALTITDYMTIADIGAGSGYFTRKFVWAVQD